MQERTALLIGEDGLARLQASRVAVVGLGGVGGHCAEALARAGVGRLFLVDGDIVALSNLNRQLVATKRSLGMKKTEAMWKRIADVSDCLVETDDRFVSPDNVSSVLPRELDFIVDAVDTLSGKLALVAHGQACGVPVISCMGAGNRLDPMAFSVMDLYETEGCPLARRMRQAARKMGVRSLPVVCSSETPKPALPGGAVGSFAPVTAAAGLCLAAYVLRRLLDGGAEDEK